MSSLDLLIRKRCTFSLALVLLWLGTGSQASDQNWLAPIKSAYDRVDAKLQNFSMKGSVFNKDELVGKLPSERKLVRTFEFSRAGDCFKTVRPQDQVSDLKIYAAANESYFFLIHDNATGNSRSLDDLSERAAFTLANGRRRKALNLIFDDAAWATGVFGFPLESPFAVLNHNADHLRAREIEEGGRKYLLLEGDFARFIDTSGISPPEALSLTVGNSRLLLDPVLDYRIVRWESKKVQNGKEYVITQTFEYDHAVDGYPVLSKFRHYSGTPSVGHGTLEVEFTDWRLNVNKPAEFRLSHFGLKEPDFGRKPFLSGWLRLLLIGVALVVVGIWLYRRTAARAM